MIGPAPRRGEGANDDRPPALQIEENTAKGGLGGGVLEPAASGASPSRFVDLAIGDPPLQRRQRVVGREVDRTIGRLRFRFTGSLATVGPALVGALRGGTHARHPWLRLPPSSPRKPLDGPCWASTIGICAASRVLPEADITVRQQRSPRRPDASVAATCSRNSWCSPSVVSVSTSARSTARSTWFVPTRNPRRFSPRHPSRRQGAGDPAEVGGSEGVRRGDRGQRGHLRHWLQVPVSRARCCDGGSALQYSEVESILTRSGRGRRALGLLAGRHDGKGRSLSASALRRPARHGRQRRWSACSIGGSWSRSFMRGRTLNASFIILDEARTPRPSR